MKLEVGDHVVVRWREKPRIDGEPGVVRLRHPKQGEVERYIVFVAGWDWWVPAVHLEKEES